MAIGWLAILQSVPWTDVISNAPKVADGAKKLWKTVGKKTAGPGTAVPSTDSPEVPTLASQAARIATLEARSAELHSQMLASSELISALAEQNAQLIKRIEANRVRVLWLSGVVVALVVMAVLGVGR